MPNWVTTRLYAAPQVIEALLDDNDNVDFNKIVPFTGLNLKGFGISDTAEDVAKNACGIPVSSHPLIGLLEELKRKKADIRKISDFDFHQVLDMLRNYRACGYLHIMDFARNEWGTQWNARETLRVSDNVIEFETPWDCPKPVLVKLSLKFPDDHINVKYADEDLGSNCGSYDLLNGEVHNESIAPNWREMNVKQRKSWRAFACAIRGVTDLKDDEKDNK